MPHIPDNLVARFAPATFVFLWSTGFIGAKYGLPYAEPLTFLTLRMLFVVVVFLVIVAIARPKWLTRSRVGPQRGRRLARARDLSRRRLRRDQPRRAGRHLRAHSRVAADPDRDHRQPLSRRARHAAAMVRPDHGPGRRRAGPAGPPCHERRDRRRLGRDVRVASRHHARLALPEALLLRDRLACRQSCAIHHRRDPVRARRARCSRRAS